MAWSTPPTFVSGNVLTAAQMNVLAADLLETFPSKVTGLTVYNNLDNWWTSMPYPVATAANTITSRQCISSYQQGPGTTTSATPAASLTATDGSTLLGPLGTMVTGASALIMLNCTCKSSLSGTLATAVEYVDGVASTVNLISIGTAAANQQFTTTGLKMLTGLTPGISHDFGMSWAVSGGATATFSRMYMTVMSF